MKKISYKLFIRDGFPITRAMDAISIGTWIFMRPNQPNHLLEHEKTHVKQFREEPFTFWWKYLTDDQARLQYEAEAYAVSINNGMDEVVASLFLASNYELNITERQALNEINKWRGKNDTVS